jgi:hypothetical protein
VLRKDYLANKFAPEGYEDAPARKIEHPETIDEATERD